MISYTGSKLISDSASSNAGGGTGGEFRVGRLNRRQDRAIDESDISQRMVISTVYELPFGSGRRFLKDGGVLGHIFGVAGEYHRQPADRKPPDSSRI